MGRDRSARTAGKSRSPARSIIEGLADVGQPFIAPIPSRQTDVIVLQDNLPRKYHIPSIEPGWYEFEPTSHSTAVVAGNVSAPVKFRYLEQLPLARYFVFQGARWKRAFCFAFNKSDVQQRGLPEHCVVTIITQVIRPGDLINVRFLGEIPIFDRITRWPNHLASRRVGQYKRVMALVRDAEEKRRRAEYTITRAERARRLLGFHGAELVELTGNRVLWRDLVTGYEYGMAVDDSLVVTSAGVCLSQRDRDFSLDAIVNVMRGR